MENIIKKGYPLWEKKILLTFMDTLIVLTSYLLALLMRFDFLFSNIPEEYYTAYILSMPFWVVSTIVVFYGVKLYHRIWRLSSISDFASLISAHLILIAVYAIGVLFMHLQMPKSYYFMGFIIAFCCFVGVRFIPRVYFYCEKKQQSRSEELHNDRVMIIGAGAAGQALIKEMLRSNKIHTKVCCIIDDNPVKQDRMLEGIPIVGNRHDIIYMAKIYHITRIIYAIPTSTVAERKEILNICKETGCHLQTVPGIYQLVNGEVSVSKLRNVEIQDLLGREQIQVNNDEILEFIHDKVVLVTGGGGSIGSELCRQIAKAGPKQLIIFDMYENNAYEIQQELKREHKELNLLTLIGSVRNTNRINSVMQKYKPDVVYHAAAHKHVPLMEDSPNEAIKNNVIGTYKTAVAAANAGVGKFVLISTDKAVNPTNIMGASKRLCEMVVQMMGRRSETDFVAVRFGNVLGSNGSVIPLFKKQIEAGGPVTVTDKRIIRYFMTIPEAVSLVLQASYYAKGGEIFVLDMGEPVKIDDMARNMIRLSGYIPDEDIQIVYTGLRPGEKLYEELLMDDEGLQSTANELIHIGKPIEMDDDYFLQKIYELDWASKGEADDIKRIVSEIVPTYHYQNGKN